MKRMEDVEVANHESPLYNTLLDETNDSKFCRICLDDDDKDQMIAPCKCSGTSRWVHRDCLDRWRLNEKDRAFSRCTECFFEYHMKPSKKLRWHRAKYCMLISRDFLFVGLALQAVIALLGYIVWLIDRDQNSIASLLDGKKCFFQPLETNTTHSNYVNHFWCDHALSAYYLCGLVVLLIVLGFTGLTILSMNKCSLENSIPSFDDAPTEHGRGLGSADRGDGYRRQRRLSRRNDDGCCEGSCCSHHNVYYCPSDNDCCCCLGCGNHYTNHYNSRSDEDCCCCCSEHVNGCHSGHGGGGNDNECAHLLFLAMLVIAIAMAVIGFITGIILTVVICQRIVQRHAFLLHKKSLVDEFQVVDLANHDLTSNYRDNFLSLKPFAPSLETTPIAPTLEESDLEHLRGLGLKD